MMKLHTIATVGVIGLNIRDLLRYMCSLAV